MLGIFPLILFLIWLKSKLGILFLILANLAPKSKLGRLNLGILFFFLANMAPKSKPLFFPLFPPPPIILPIHLDIPPNILPLLLGSGSAELKAKKAKVTKQIRPKRVMSMLYSKRGNYKKNLFFYHVFHLGELAKSSP